MSQIPTSAKHTLAKASQQPTEPIYSTKQDKNYASIFNFKMSAAAAESQHAQTHIMKKKKTEKKPCQQGLSLCWYVNLDSFKYECFNYSQTHCVW